MPRKMKESGVEWLGQIPEGWGVRRNKYCYACGKEIVGSKSSDTTLLSLTTRGVKEKPAGAVGGKQPETFDTYQVVRPNDIVLCLFDLDCSAVFSGISHYDGMISPAYKVVSCKRFVCSQYAEYWFRFVSEGRKFKAYAKNLRYTLSYEEFETLPMLCPPLPEQERIAAFLDERCAKIDGMIAEAKASIEDYKKWKQSIIFEAVTGKHEKNLKPSGVDWIGDVPEGWKVCNASRVIHSTQNGLTRRDLVGSSGEIVLRLKNINPSGIVDYSSVVRMRLTEAERSRYALREGDLLFARVNGSRELVGKCAVFCTQSEIVAYNDHLIRVRLNDCMDVKYFTYYLTSSAGRTEIDKYVITAAGQCTISGEGLRLVKVVLPTYENQRRIAAELDEKCAAIDKLVGEKEALIADLEAYKKSLIFETVTGKREVA